MAKKSQNGNKSEETQGATEAVNAVNMEAATETPPERRNEGGTLRRLLRAAQSRPVTTLALGAGVGALLGAELLAAGLAGGAAILLLQRGDLRKRARHFVDVARDHINDGLRTIEHRP